MWNSGSLAIELCSERKHRVFFLSVQDVTLTFLPIEFGDPPQYHHSPPTVGNTEIHSISGKVKKASNRSSLSSEQMLRRQFVSIDRKVSRRYENSHFSSGTRCPVRTYGYILCVYEFCARQPKPNRQNVHVIITTCRNKLYRRESAIFLLPISLRTFFFRSEFFVGIQARIVSLCCVCVWIGDGTTRRMQVRMSAFHNYRLSDSTGLQLGEQEIPLMMNQALTDSFAVFFFSFFFSFRH